MARPAAGTPYTDPCAVADNAEVFGKLLNEAGTQTTYNGVTLVSYQDALDNFGFGVAPFTFATGGVLSSLNLLVSNAPTSNLIYKYIGAGSAPITVTAGTNPVGNPNWQAFTATSLQALSGLSEPSALAQRVPYKTTVAEVATGVFLSGDRLDVSDRLGERFNVATGGTPNGRNIIPAGADKTAQLQANSTKRYPLSVFGIVPSTSGQSEAIQAAMEICAENKAWLQIDGVYWVESRNLLMDDGVLSRPTCLYIPSGSRIEFLPGAEIRQVANNLDTTYVMNFYLKNNIEIVNPVVYGDKTTHTGTAGEYGHCYNITSCSNIKLINPQAYDAWGDCFYIGLEYQSTVVRHCENITVIDAVYDNASRNGISFTSGKNVFFSLASGGTVSRVPPQAGIDLEPEFGGGAAIKPTYENCHLWLNFKGGMSTGLTFFLADPLKLDKCDVTIHDLKCDGTGPVAFKNTANVTNKGLIRVGKLTVLNASAYPLAMQWLNCGLKLVIDEVVTSNSNVSGPVSSPFDSFVYIENTPGFDSGGFYVNKITRVNETKQPFAYRSLVTSNLVDFAINFDSDFGISTQVSGPITKQVKGTVKASYFDLDSAVLGLSHVELQPSTLDGITVKLSSNTRFTQTYTKTNTNAFEIIFKPDTGKTLNYNGTNRTTVRSSTPGAKCEILDDGSGNKILVALAGSWSAT